MTGSFKPWIWFLVLRLSDKGRKRSTSSARTRWRCRKTFPRVTTSSVSGENYILSFLIGSHDLNLIWSQKVGRRRSCTSVGLLRFCQTCLRIRILKLEKETIKRNISSLILSLWVLSSLFDLAKSHIHQHRASFLSCQHIVESRRPGSCWWLPVVEC